MNLKNNLVLGHLGESIAKEFLRRKGYTIIETNVHKRGGELDLVLVHKNTLVFVEVKCRRGDAYGLPEESITPWKLRAVVNSAQYYKLRHPKLPDALRIDVISIIVNADDTPYTIKHFENVSGF